MITVLNIALVFVWRSLKILSVSDLVVYPMYWAAQFVWLQVSR